ncbi:lysylphosphatidylglycerol synthase domain-containing protein [Prochlorococcus sp. MIT 1307]|uniref:lysylphosphatidylglycerol synthase domain-containing protein n=1 Tax=Prochlorococcus sp. MIT 1307 TaxID=3096219 RepID=UPI002A75DF55|nr:lysylphosphatidylglycerol synthase domain-containing protein [Prochlorococcus sp. MIT 1307]
MNVNLRRLKLFLAKVSPPGGFRLWITITSLTFVGYSLFRNSENFNKIPLDTITFSWISFGIGVSLLSLIVNAIAWRLLLSWLDYDSNKIELIPLFLSSNLLKYLPGGIWHFVERLRALRSQMGSGQALASVLLEPLLMAAAALLWVPLGGFQSGLEGLCIIPALCFIKRFRDPLLRRLERLKANQLEQIYSEIHFGSGINNISLQRSNYPFKALIAEILFVLFRFLGFWCCLNAFSLESAIPFMEWMAAFALAWTIGLVVPAAPGGVGVFEAALLIRVGTYVPEAPLLATLLCYRLTATIADLFAGFGVLLRSKIIASNIIN